jgi:predicted Zn-dependent protease
MPDSLQERFRALTSNADFWSLRFVEEETDCLAVRQNVVMPPQQSLDRGAMLTAHVAGGIGYAATSDLSRSGLQAALERASEWARATARHGVVDTRKLAMPDSRGEYRSPDELPLPSRRELYDLLRRESANAKCHEAIVDWQSTLVVREAEHRYLTSQGADVVQRYRQLTANVSATANRGSVTQTRSLGGQYNGFCQQGGGDVIARAELAGAGRRVAEEALQLLDAPNCPSGRMDLLLMPDQMMLQIHESIGHPLELDRILGDERNFAGTSFVTPDMFGSYRYGSPLLNVTFDPTLRGEFASYGYDDDGSPAEKAYLIRAGILERPLGSLLSQTRAGLPGVANSRAEGWNRPPIDRMANLNIEPGEHSLADLIAGVERGVLKRTNVSWSIDDSRNKFQFGCEWGQLIENGRLTRVVKNPNYRGISATFWRSLKKVGDASTFEVLGTPYCGKGEPGQTIRCGHASPACVFADIDVFGGEG